MLAYLQEYQVKETTILVADAPGEVAFFSSNKVLALDMLTANRIFVNKMLASPNSLQFILEQATQAGLPITRFLFTTDTWFGLVSVDDDFENVNYQFLIPGSARARSSSSLYLGLPVYRQPHLIVWQIR